MDNHQSQGLENCGAAAMISDSLTRTLTHISEQSFAGNNGDDDNNNNNNNNTVDDSEHTSHAYPVYPHPQQRDDSWRLSQVPTESHVLPRLTVAELNKRFPTITVPRLYCFTSVLSPVGADANKILRDMEPTPKKRTKREVLVKKMRRSYHLSHSNEATTQRIMKRFNDNELTVDLNESDIARVMSLEYLPWRTDSTRESMADRGEDKGKWLEPTSRSSRSDGSETYRNNDWLTFPLLAHTENCNNLQPFHSADHNSDSTSWLLPLVSPSHHRHSCGNDDSVRTSMPVKLPRLIHTSGNTASLVREQDTDSAMWTNYT